MNRNATRFMIGVFSFFIVLGGMGILASPTSASGNNAVSNARFAHFTKGINLTRWLWINRGPVDEIEKRFSDDDFRLIKSLGLTHVRIPIDMANVYDPAQNDLLNKKTVAILDRGLQKILGFQLAVIVDLHSINQKQGGSNYSGPLGKDASFTDTFCRFWTSFAKHLSQFDPDRVILEPMNEPVLSGDETKWPPVQAQVVAAIRKGAPKHTILATGARWSNLATLLELEPLEDPNIVYNFHFYEPHIFTHQGATWSSDWVKPLREIPYPSSPEAVKPAIDLIDDPAIKKHITRYGEQRWNAEKIDGKMKQAAAWAKRHGVKVTCDEWGAYRRYCLPKYRAAWIRDVRTALEKYGIGWCMWDYESGFNLVTRQNGKAVVDRQIAQALGLNVK